MSGLAKEPLDEDANEAAEDIFCSNLGGASVDGRCISSQSSAIIEELLVERESESLSDTIATYAAPICPHLTIKREVGDTDVSYS